MPGLTAVLTAVILFLSLAFFLKLFYLVPIKDSLLWYVGVFFCFYIPGNLLVRFSDENNEEFFIGLFHSLALGTALTPLFYIILRKISHPELAYLFGIVIFLVWLLLNIRDFKQGRISVRTSFLDICSFLMIIAFVVFLLHLSYFTDVVFLENGFKLRNLHLNESVFHLGIINSLKDVFPPIYPYASNISFNNYHLNMHYEIEMFNRLFSINTLKLTFFYFPFLYFSLLVFVPYMYVRKSWNIGIIGIAIGILMFGSDLSFIPGFLGIFPRDFPWIFSFTPTIWSIFLLNGNLPALFVLFLCILYLKKYYDDGKLLHLITFGLLGFSAYGFKSSMGPHIIGASFLTGIVLVFFKQDKRKSIYLCIVSVLAALTMVIDEILVRGSAGNILVNIDLLSNFKYSISKLGISYMPWFLYPLVFPFYVVATFGVRVLGFYILKEIFEKKYFDSVVIFLTIFVVSGFLLSDIIFIGDSSRITNNSVWFSVQSLMAAWLLLFYSLMRLKHYGLKIFSAITLVILFSAPATVQFLILRFDPNYYTIGSHAVEVIKYLETTQPRSVILHPANIEEPSFASNLTGRPSVINCLWSFTVQNIGQTEAFARLRDVQLFFNSQEEMDRPSILRKYKVDYVYAPLEYAFILDREPMLSKVLKNSEYVVYRVKIGSSMQERNNHNK